tara:strand:- start:3593 stop:4819 length:1227 start_codon:yes stop_codon:yes gene_type:complete
MTGNNRTLKINPELFKLNSKIKNNKKNRTNKIKCKPELDIENSSNANKIKKELMKKVKDYQKNKEQELSRENNVGLNKNNLESDNFNIEFNNSLSFLQDLAKKNKEKKRKNTLKNNSNLTINLDLSENLKKENINDNNNNDNINYNYGCLKNGIKPTFRQLNKTLKNNNDNKPKVKIMLNNNVYEENSNRELKLETIEVKPETIELKPETIELKPETIELKPETIELKSDIVEQKPDIVDIKTEIIDTIKKETIDSINRESIDTIKTDLIETVNNISNNNDDNDYVCDINNNIDDKHDKEDILKLKNIPKINRISRKKIYKLGKNKDTRKISILIKNKETQKNIRNEIRKLKSKPLNEIKDFLIQKNLIKVGSNAPPDVFRKLYENSILSGEINNKNNNNMLYNYYNN